MSRSGVFAGLALAAALVTGAAIGYALGRSPRRGSGIMVAKTQNAAVLFLSRSSVLDSLHLSADQRRHVDSVLADGNRRAEAAIEGIREEVQTVTSQTRDGIRAVLDGRQRVVFDSTLASLTPVRMRSPVRQ